MCLPCPTSDSSSSHCDEERAPLWINHGCRTRQKCVEQILILIIAIRIICVILNCAWYSWCKPYIQWKPSICIYFSFSLSQCYMVPDFAFLPLLVFYISPSYWVLVWLWFFVWLHCLLTDIWFPDSQFIKACLKYSPASSQEENGNRKCAH